MTKIKSEQVWKEAERINRVKRDDHGTETIAICLASAFVGPSIKRIAKFLGLSRWKVSERSKNLRKNGIWMNDEIHAEWFGKHGGVALIADSLVADGLAMRVYGK